MKELAINGTPRESAGKKGVNQLRREGMVPCNIYGGAEHTYFYAHENEFKKLVYTPEVHQVVLNVGGKTFKAFMQEIQFHPVSDKILHIDFMQVADDKKMKVEIPVKISGTAVGITQGGRLVQKLRKMKVKALAKDMPDFIEINVANLNIGQSVRVSEIKLPGVEFLDTLNGVIVGVQTTRVVVEEATKSAATTTAAATPAAATPAAAPAAEKKPAAKK